MLGVTARLHDDRARCELIGVDQRHRNRIGGELFDQRSHSLRNARSTPDRIEVAQPAMQHRPPSSGIDPAQHQLRERHHTGRIVFHRVVGQARVRSGRVVSHPLEPPANIREVTPEYRFGIARVVAVEIREPRVSGHLPAIRCLHGQIVDLERIEVVRRGNIAIPAVVSVHARVHRPPVNDLFVRVDRVGLLAPRVQESVIPGQHVRVHETEDAPMLPIAVGQCAGLRDDHGKPPAVRAAVPLAVTRSADRSVQADVRRNDVAVGDHALPPRFDVLEQPPLVLRLAGQHERIQRQRGR